MKNKTLLRTNLLVCFIIVTGFIITSVISYQSNMGIFEKDVEMVSTLSSEGLYNDITSIFSQPVSVALTMANDSLLKDFLTDEESEDGNEWQKRMRDYLSAYQLKYNYDSVFLASTSTNNYYHFEGLDRVLTPDNPENDWYYSFLERGEEYTLNVDNDEATDNSITVFVNCKIKGIDGSTLGIVGVGLRVESLQTLLGSYEEKYGVHACLVDGGGVIEISSSATGHEKTVLFDTAKFSNYKNVIMQNKNSQESFWYSGATGDGYVVTRYEPNLKWHLVVENDTSAAHNVIGAQMVRNVGIIILIIILVLVIITNVIKRYNVRISELTVSQELEYQRLLNEATGGLYDEIYEMDITHNCAGGEGTREYFASLGLSPDASYDKVLHVLAGKQLKSEYIQGYLDTFSPLAVLEAYKNGTSNLSYDLMISEDGTNYQWVRISAQIFYWNSDESVRMITYRKNINAEKSRELALLEGIRKDSMTGLYNKRATEELISDILEERTTNKSPRHALLIFDIDNFKTVNDTMGHSFGDHVINELAAEIKTQFREQDIVGRIGGDEFAVLMKQVEDTEALRLKLARLCGRIAKKNFGETEELTISCSIGVALFPQDGITYSELYEKADQALYQAKSHGKNSFVLFDEREDNYSYRVNQRDLEALMNTATDGLAQYACTDSLKLLYFNSQCVELFGSSANALPALYFNLLEQIHPDDREEVSAVIKSAEPQRRQFTWVCRFRHQDGHYMTIKVNGVFISELYKNKYPVFYIMYRKQGEAAENSLRL